MVSLKDYYGLTWEEIYCRAYANDDSELLALLILAKMGKVYDSDKLPFFPEKPENGL